MMTYYLASVKTGVVYADLPFQDVSMSWELSDSGSFSGKLKVSDPEVVARRGLSIVCGETSILADKDGDLVWAGIVWATEYDSESQTLAVSALDYWSYLRKRIVTDSKKYTYGDIQDSFSWIMGFGIDTSAPAGLGWGLSHPDGWDGPYVPYPMNYVGTDRRSVAEWFEEFAKFQLDNGIDFIQRTSWSAPETPSILLEIGRPYVGRPLTSSDAYFSYPGNILKYNKTTDGAELLNKIWGQREDDGGKITECILTNDAALLTAPRYEAVYSSDSFNTAALNEHTAQFFQVRKRPRTEFTISVRADAYPVLSSYRAGDICQIVIQDSMHPEQIVAERRIGSMTYTPENETVEILPWDPTNDEA